MTTSQYGKSLTVALACIILTCVFGIDVVVVAPSKEKAKIIMRYYIEHIGDSPLFFSKLEKNTRLERLRQEESKNRIKLNNGGGIFVISTDEKNSQKSIESAMGEGGTVTILDEAGLVNDRNEATIFRMIAGKKNGTYVKIGNPFYSAPPYSHFIGSWNSMRYFRIFVDYYRAMAEGRLSADFIEEAKTKPLFDILFGCEFPSLDVPDSEGYRPICLPTDIKLGVTPEDVVKAYQKAKEGGSKERLRLGFDVAAGGDDTVCVLRWGFLAALVEKRKTKDTMQIVGFVEEMQKKFGVSPDNTYIDDIGVGRGASDRLKETGNHVISVNVGEAAVFDGSTFANLKAELYWAVRTWVKDDRSRLSGEEAWGEELPQIRYKTLSDRKIQIEPKDRLKARIHRSPDTAEALMLTFYERPFVGFA